MIMRSIRDSITTIEITAQRPRVMPDVQYVYIQKFAKCTLIFENSFIIFKSIIFIFIYFFCWNINHFKWGL